jgi:hypothetical protein
VVSASTRTRVGVALRAALGLASALLLFGGSCGGGSGSGGDPPVVRVDAPDARCLALPSQFPAGFDFATDAPGRVVAASFAPGVVVPADVESVPPRATTNGPFADLRTAIAADACRGFLDPAFDGVFAAAPDLALVTASTCEAVAFTDARSGALRDLTVATPAGVGATTWPFLPAPGTEAPLAAVSTRTCLVPPEGAVDSRGVAVPLGCDASRPSFFSSFTSGAAVAGGALFVSTSNLGANAGRPDTQFLPGTVLVFDFDLAATPPRVAPAATAALFTTGFNPTHATAHRTRSGRAFVLVTVSGALGLVPDDPTTPEREAGGAALTPAAVDVIEVASRRLVATIPLGLAAASFDRIAIDPSGRIAVLGASNRRWLYAIDLAPLDALAAPAPGAPPLVLDGSTGPNAVIFDANAPLVLPSRPDGAPAATCAGYVVGADFDANGTKVFATDFCDGTLGVVGVDVPGAPAPFPPSRFRVLDSLVLTAPLGATSVGLARAPGAIRVRRGRPGVDYRGPDVLFTTGIPEGQLCGVRIDSR